MAGEQRFVFINELDFKLGGEDIVARIRRIFADLRAESEAALKKGTSATVRPGYTSAIGETTALVSRAPGLSAEQRREALGVIGSATRTEFPALQNLGSQHLPPNLQLQDLNAGAIEEAYRKAAKNIDKSVAEQSNAILGTRDSIDKVGQAENKAANAAERAAAVKAQREKEATPEYQAGQQVNAAQQRAQIAKQLASGGQYAQQQAAAAVSFAQIRAQTQGILANTPAYGKAVAAGTIAQAQINAQVQTQLAASKQYTQAQLQTSIAKAREAANLTEAQAASKSYIAAQRRGATADATLSARQTEAETASKSFINAQRRASTAQENQTAAIAEAQASSKTWVRAQARSTVAESARSAAVQEALASSRAYTDAQARSTIAQQQQAANLQTALSRAPAYIDSRAQEATAKASIAEQLANNKQYTDAQTQAALAQRTQAAVIAENLAVSKENISAQVRTTVARKEEAASIAAELATNREYIQAKARSAVAQRQEAAAVQRATSEQLQAAGLSSGGSLFQRLLASTKNRGAGGTFALPEDQPTGGQYLLSKVTTTAGYLASGALFFGAVQGFRDIVKEASALQRELAVVKSQFDELGNPQGFQQFTNKILDIAQNTGVAANQVALVARQLSGVFRDSNTGLPDFNKALDQTNEALKITQVTGLPLQEVTDSLTAITTSLGTSFKQIGDDAIGLEARFGVLAPQIIQFVADLAPVGKQLGLTTEQLGALAAISQQRSGVAGNALAESFNRALPAISQSQAKLAEILQQTQATKGFVGPILDALSQGNGKDAIVGLTEAYAAMDKQQQDALGELLGGQRNAKAFFAILQGGKETIDALNNSDPAQFAGKLDDRFKDFQSTVEFAFEHMRQALEKFGLALFNSGVADGLKTIADAGAGVANVAAALLKAFGSLNDALGGLPVKILAVYAAMKLVMALVAGGRGFAGLIGSVIGGGGGAAAAAAATGGAGTGTLAGLSPEAGLLLGVGGAGGVARRAPLFDSAIANKIKSAAGLATGVGVENVAGLGSEAGVKSSLAGALEVLAPLIAATAVTELVAKVVEVKGQIEQAGQNLDKVVADQLSKGVSPAEILKRASAFKDSPKLFGVVAIPALTGATPFERALDDVQKANAARQGEELKAITDTLGDKDRQTLADFLKGPGQFAPDPTGQTGGHIDTSHADPKLVQDTIDAFLKDPANDKNNDKIARLIAFVRSGGITDPAAVQALTDIATKYANINASAAAQQAEVDYTPVLQEIQAKYALGQASLGDLVGAFDTQIQNEKDRLAHLTDPTQRAQEYQQLLQNVQGRDQALTQEYQKVATLTTKLVGIHGGDTVKAAADAALQTLKSLQTSNASPAAQLDAATAALDAEQAQLQRVINSPVIVNGIAREPTAAIKLARAAQGVPIPPEVRDAVIRGSLLIGQAGNDLQAVAKAGIDQTTAINAITTLIETGDATAYNLIRAALQEQIDYWTAVIASAVIAQALGGKGPDPAAVAALTAAKTALDALNNLPSEAKDPGIKATQDNTDLSNQNLIEQGQEAKALADALQQQQAARAHGDPVLEAQAAITAAQNAMNFADPSKPSEMAAAVAQMITAQNALVDANEQALESLIDLAAARTRDPVQKAQRALQKAQAQVAAAHGTSAELQALAAQAQAEQGLSDAIFDITRARGEYVQAVLSANGDVVGAAQAQLDAAQSELQHLVDLRNQGQDPGDAAIIRAQAQVVAQQANLRDTKLQQQESQIDFLLQMEKITTQQAIAQFTALMQIPGLTAQETQDILLKIKQLQGQLNQDLQFDIPTDIKLPTEYQVRRLIEGSRTTTQGASAYTDNRTFQFDMTINNGGDLNNAVNTIMDAVGAPPRNGSSVGPRI